MSRFNVMPRAYRRQLQAHDQAQVDRVVAETEHVINYPSTSAGATAPGDARKLRGIPAIGRSVRGAIPGSVPGEELWR
jgi:hypothetical protein